MSKLEDMSAADKLAFAGYTDAKIREAVYNWTGSWYADFDEDAIVTRVENIVLEEFDARFIASYGADMDLEVIRERGDEPDDGWIIDADWWTEICERSERTVYEPTVDQVWELVGHFGADEKFDYHRSGRREVQAAAYELGVMDGDQRFTDETAQWVLDAASDWRPESLRLHLDPARDFGWTFPDDVDRVVWWVAAGKSDGEYAAVLERGDPAGFLAALREALSASGWVLDDEPYWDATGHGVGLVTAYPGEDDDAEAAA